MVIRADSGVYITNSGGTAPYDGNKLINTSAGGYLSSGGDWISNSDVNLKENFEDIEGTEILKALSELSVQRWNYKAESDDIRHVGPTAQDFKRAFEIGVDEKSISACDIASIALIAIQELYRENRALRTELDELRGKVEKIEDKSASNAKDK
jgi:hypothetical protein